MSDPRRYQPGETASEVIERLATEVERLKSCLYAQEAVPPLYDKIKQLRADNAKQELTITDQMETIANLWAQRSEFDCRFTGDVADISGSHCPADAPCLRCQIERLRGQVAALELTGDRAELQSLLDQCGLDFERMRTERNEARAEIERLRSYAESMDALAEERLSEIERLCFKLKAAQEEIKITDGERDVLDRFVTCGTCGWVGKLGKVMAKDVLRCPKCNSGEIGYVVPAHDSNRQ